MHEILRAAFGVPHVVGTAALDESLLPVVRVAIVLVMSAVTGGAWIGRALTRSRHAADLQAACRLHDWLPMDDGGFLCLRCSYRAGSSLPAARRPRI